MQTGVSPRVVVIGPVNMDLFVRGTAPLDRATLNDWVGPSDVQLMVAGSVGYTVQAFARLGCRVELCATTGDDAFGAHIRQVLGDAGIGMRHANVAHGSTAIGIYMLLFGGSKRPLTVRMPAFEPWPDPLPWFLEDGEHLDLLHSGGLLHFPDMWGRSLAGAFASARVAGVRTSLDPQFPLVDTPAPWLPHIADVLANSDILLCDEGEAEHIFDTHDLREAIRLAHAAGPSIVAIKRGALGSLVSDGTQVLRQPAVAVPEEQVREAVGAGDAFDAGFLDALVRGQDVASAARFGTAAAAVSLRGRGGSEAIANRSAVMESLTAVPVAEAWSGAA